MEELRKKPIVRRKLGDDGKMRLEVQTGGESIKIRQGTEDATTYTMENLDGYAPLESGKHGSMKARIWGKSGGARGKANGHSPTKRTRAELKLQREGINQGKFRR